jgi:hypothetical protein
VQQLVVDFDAPCPSVEVSTARRDAATDIVGLSVRHSGHAVVVRAHLRTLGAWRHRSIAFPVETDGRDFEVSVGASRGRAPRADLSTAPRASEPDACGHYMTQQTGVPCAGGVTVRKVPARNVVSVRVPRVCIGQPRWVRAGLQVDRFQAIAGGRARVDVWGRPDVRLPIDPIPMSPRVRHSVG